MSDELVTRVERQIGILNRTVTRIKEEAEHYDRDAKIEGRLHKGFTAVLAILAVAAPALVTYETSHNTHITTIVVIAVTTLAGTGTALQSVFRWGERFRRTRLTALEIKELLIATELDKQDIEDGEANAGKFAQIRELNEKSATRLQAIIRSHIESEVALIAPPTISAQPPSDGGQTG